MEKMEEKENLIIDTAYGIRSGRIIVTQEYIDLMFGGDFKRGLKLLSDWMDLLEAILEEEHEYIS